MVSNRTILILSGPVLIAGLFACGQSVKEAEIERRTRELEQQRNELKRLKREIDSVHREQDRLLQQLNESDPIDGGSYDLDPKK